MNTASKRETITEMMNVLKRDFVEHQIFISSLYKYSDIFDEANIFEIDGTLFNEPTLFDSVE